MLGCIGWIVGMVIVAGVILWGLNALPIDQTIKNIGRVAIIVLFVVWLVSTMIGCLHFPTTWPPVLRK